MTKEEAIRTLEYFSLSSNYHIAMAITTRDREAFDMAIDALKQSRWIPIKTRPLTEDEKEDMPNADFYYDCALPDDEETVLVTTRYGDVDKAVFVSDAEGCYFEEFEEEGDVLAWMPLPSPYREENNDETANSKL